jgi:Ran-binding protein 3
VETGEEDEETLFSGRCKLFSWESKEWRERGSGNIKLNVTRDDEDEDDDDSDDDDDDRDDTDHEPISSNNSAKGAAKPDDDGEKDGAEKDDADACKDEGAKKAKPAPRQIHARFILRSDGSQRLVLNSPLTKVTQFGGDGNAAPKGTSIFFQGNQEGGGMAALRLQVRFPLLLAIGRADFVCFR